jgi:hypothetical protein
MKTKELGWKETQGIQNVSIKDSQRNRMVQRNQMLEIFENYITELHDRPNRPQTLEVKTEEEADTEQKGPYTLQRELEKSMKGMWKKKATGDDDVRGDVLKLLKKVGLKIMN